MTQFKQTRYFTRKSSNPKEIQYKKDPNQWTAWMKSLMFTSITLQLEKEKSTYKMPPMKATSISLFNYANLSLIFSFCDNSRHKLSWKRGMSNSVNERNSVHIMNSWQKIVITIFFSLSQKIFFFFKYTYYYE